MSVPTIAPYFPFRRIKIINQCVTLENSRIWILNFRKIMLEHAPLILGI